MDDGNSANSNQPTSSRMLDAVASLSKAELEQLEDELNFFAFVGLEGPLIRSLKSKLN